jgi:tetratricopeptide (TPR) repeat protein
MLRRLVISAGILGLWLALLVSLGLILPALALLVVGVLAGVVALVVTQLRSAELSVPRVDVRSLRGAVPAAPRVPRLPRLPRVPVERVSGGTRRALAAVPPASRRLGSASAVEARRLGRAATAAGQKAQPFASRLDDALRGLVEAALAPIRRRRRRSALTREAWALNAEGVEHRRGGRAGAAVDAHEQAVALFRQLADDRNEGLALNNLGLALMSTGDDTGAIDAFERALALLGRSGDRPAEGRVLANLGTLYRRLDRQETALDYWRQALTRLEADSPEHERMAELLQSAR